SNVDAKTIVALDRVVNPIGLELPTACTLTPYTNRPPHRYRSSSAKTSPEQQQH
ncbi:unnamed protein product, partial [Ceratitis capitata]